jgi:hypothetical protein
MKNASTGFLMEIAFILMYLTPPIYLKFILEIRGKSEHETAITANIQSSYLEYVLIAQCCDDPPFLDRI